MTWIEITFFILLPLTFSLGFAMDMSGDSTSPACILLPLMFSAMFGLMPATIVDANTETTFIKEVPVKILSNVMINNKMVIITDSVDEIVFSEYKDIVNMNAGKGLVKRYYEKNVYYGFNSKWNAIEIK
jgi:hypothetical protein